jgi:hypothetical protein
VEDATCPQALLKKEAERLREPVGVPVGDSAAQRHTQPNKGMEPTASSVRFAPAFVYGWGLALECWRAHTFQEKAV